MDIEDTAASSADNAWYGVFLAGEGAAEVFWRMTCLKDYDWWSLDAHGILVWSPGA